MRFKSFLTIKLFVVLCLAHFAGFGQPKSKFVCMDTTTQSNILMYEFQEEYTLTTEETTADEFNKHKKKNKKDKNDNIGSVLLTDSSITVYLAKGEKEFRSTQTEVFEYVRQIPSLNQHIVLHLSASSSTASLLLVDGISGYVTSIFSPFDSCPDDLILSPNHKMLVAVVNDVYEKNLSAIMTIRINQDDKGYTLEPEILLTFDTFSIGEFCWSEDDSIIIETIHVAAEDAGQEEQQSRGQYQRISWKK